ncbi:Zinc finger protein [Melia azedarach]|uniref:Zinc finger protein n=1 Tax=Melia azedarach TaxID=155640 RepID=A0ACC1XSX1_MELAZ|nr:Zinc finger protein [Melia azedarach]
MEQGRSNEASSSSKASLIQFLPEVGEAAKLADAYLQAKRIFCSLCGKEFRSFQALGGHMNAHKEERATIKKTEQKMQMLKEITKMIVLQKKLRILLNQKEEMEALKQVMKDEHHVPIMFNRERRRRSLSPVPVTTRFHVFLESKFAEQYKNDETGVNKRARMERALDLELRVGNDMDLQLKL